jgi:hypothetical protein
MLDIVLLSALMRTLHLPAPLVRAVESFLALDDVTKIGVIAIVTILALNATETFRELVALVRHFAPVCVKVVRACVRFVPFMNRPGA